MEEDIREGTSTFIIRALIPAVESFTLSGELRHGGGGDVHYHAKFHGFKVMPEDPFYEMSLNQEELEDEGDITDISLQTTGRKILTSIRKRKGLVVDERMVKDATKQRTMTRMK